MFLGSTTTTTASLRATVTTSPSTVVNGSVFKAQLDASLDAELVRRVRALLDRRTSLTDVVSTLAGSLATSVANVLGIPLDAAKEQLTQTFTQALARAGTGSPQTNAERASSLVSRFRQIAELATRVTNGDTGQPIRTIAGQRSDAAQAKAIPVPTPPSVPAATSRIVALAPTQAIATGGDTPIGRILARAALAPAASATANIVDAFVHAFATALAHDDAGSPARHDDPAPAQSILTSPLPIAGSTDLSQQAVPFAIPIAHDAAPILPPAPAPTLAQPAHVDPNAVVEQVLRGLSLRTADGSSEVRLRLVPESLGDVSVKLVVSGGSVDASITAHSADAQNVLAGAQNQLAKTLADAGLKLQSFSVGLAGGGFADTRDQSNPNPWTRQTARRIAGVSALDADDGDDSSLLAIPSFGPPISTANRTLGALNYLA